MLPLVTAALAGGEPTRAAALDALEALAGGDGRDVNDAGRMRFDTDDDGEVIGTAAKVGECFFARLIGVLARLLARRGAVERAAADASLALWALAWQPSNRAAAVDVVIAPLLALRRDGSEAAAEDASAVLSVLVRTDAGAREKTAAVAGPDGPALVKALVARHDSLVESPKRGCVGGGQHPCSGAGEERGGERREGRGPSLAGL